MLFIFMASMIFRYIKTDQIVILTNICVSLGLAYLVFVIGVDKTENDVSLLYTFLKYISFGIIFHFCCNSLKVI